MVDVWEQIKTVKTLLIVLNSGPETVRINTIYNTFLLKTVSFQWVAQPVQSWHYRCHLLPDLNEYIKYVYPRHTRFHANWLNDNRLQGWYYVKNVSRHQHDKNR